MNKKLILTASMLALLAGCDRAEHSYEWYVENGDKASKKVKDCLAKPQIAETPDCKNAFKALDAIQFSSGGVLASPKP